MTQNHPPNYPPTHLPFAKPKKTDDRDADERSKTAGDAREGCMKPHPPSCATYPLALTTLPSPSQGEIKRGSRARVNGDKRAGTYPLSLAAPFPSPSSGGD